MGGLVPEQKGSRVTTKRGRWKLTDAECAELVKDPAFRKASGTLMLWAAATGDSKHPKVVKANAALGKVVRAWCERRALRSGKPLESGGEGGR